MEGRIQIDRFAVKNFRSIKECDVKLRPLTFFIGSNASGKTSFVDAIQFVASALRGSLQKAMDERNGASSILRQPISLPTTVEFSVDLSSAAGFHCRFRLVLRIVEDWSVSVEREECRVRDALGAEHHYSVVNGVVSGSAAVFPSVSVDRVFLSNASGLPEFRLPFEYLANLRIAEPSMPGLQIAMDRSNPEGLTVRFRNLRKHWPDRLEIIHEYLRAIAPQFDRIDVLEVNKIQLLRFIEKSLDGEPRFFALWQVSAGLVSAAKALLELFEPSREALPESPVIIEEPEAFLHPGAIHVMRDAFLEASKIRQVLVTTHSPDLLDDPAVPANSIRVVDRDEEGTHVNVLDPATESIIQDQLSTPGQLLRRGGLALQT